MESITLRDEQSGSTARVLPGYGFNCYSFCPVVEGQPWEVLWSAPGFDSGTLRPSHSGIPLLFPFPGRLRGTRLDYDGRNFTIGESTDPHGNAIHGFALRRPWRVVDRGPARVVGEFWAARQDPAIVEMWPADFRLSVSYEVRGAALVSEIEIANPGDRPLPCGLGTHPYFRVPLGPRGSADDCRVTVPVGERWLLADMLPSGQRETVGGAGSLAAGLRFADTKFDDIFTGLRPEADQVVATIDDPSNRRRLTIAFSEAFRACVVYNPPHREAICIEPYTCVPDPFSLAARGIDAGLRVLAPGENVRLEVRISLECP